MKKIYSLKIEKLIKNMYNRCMIKYAYFFRIERSKKWQIEGKKLLEELYLLYL